MRKTIVTLAAMTATLGGLAVAAPAEAATRTLTSGVYATPDARDIGLLPKWVPVARPGVYKTSGRPKHKACMLRALDMWNDEVANVILVQRRSYTIRIPDNAMVIEVAGPCKWVRK